MRLCIAALLLLTAGCQPKSSGSKGSGSGGPPLPDFQVELVDLFPDVTFDSPIALLQPRTDPTTWFIIQRGGEIWTVNISNLAAKTLFDTVPDVDADGEGGLLGAAFHPDHPTTGELFLSYTIAGSGGGNPLDSIVSRFNISGGLLGTEDVLIQLDQPEANHNGGNIAFGPDGMLYIGFGDGGGGGDMHGDSGNGQDRTTLLGKILRIDVSGGTGYTAPPDNPFFGEGGGVRNEIFAYGFRNPWRFSFDSSDGELWVGDVGQNAYEEVDNVIAGGNYGWRAMEGNHCFNPSSDCQTDDMILPVLEYSHSGGNCSVTGGFVYRGTAYPELVGYYFYGDLCSGRIYAYDAESGTAGSVGITSFNVAGFGQGLDGELYVLDLTGGRIFHMTAAP